jgi:hypothetical protein
MGLNKRGREIVASIYTSAASDSHWRISGLLPQRDIPPSSQPIRSTDSHAHSYFCNTSITAQRLGVDDHQIYAHQGRGGLEGRWERPQRSLMVGMKLSSASWGWTQGPKKAKSSPQLAEVQEWKVGSKGTARSDSKRNTTSRGEAKLDR